MQAYNDAAFDSYNTKALEPCPNCARTFLPESLAKHQKHCKGNQAMSSVRRTLDAGANSMMPTGSQRTFASSKDVGQLDILDR